MASSVEPAKGLRTNIPERRARRKADSGPWSDLRNKLGEGGELLADKADRLLVGDFAGLGIDPGRAVADEDFGLVESDRVEKDHRPAQVVLHAAAAKSAVCSRLQGHRFA